MKLKHYFLAPLATVLLATSGIAGTVTWAGGAADQFFNPYGTTLDGSYWFELGTFGSSFTPTDANKDQWAANWKVFDRASSDILIDPVDEGVLVGNPIDDSPGQRWNPSGGILSGGILSAKGWIDDTTGKITTNKFNTLTSLDAQAQTTKYLAADANYDFRTQAAYIWIFNDRTAVFTSNWGLFTSTSPTPWVFPSTPDPTCGCLIADFYLRDINSPVGPPVSQPPLGTILTLTPVPEPGSAILILAAGIILLIKRRRFQVA
jgi:hypothetical protein